MASSYPSRGSIMKAFGSVKPRKPKQAKIVNQKVAKPKVRKVSGRVGGKKRV